MSGVRRHDELKRQQTHFSVQRLTEWSDTREVSGCTLDAVFGGSAARLRQATAGRGRSDVLRAQIEEDRPAVVPPIDRTRVSVYSSRLRRPRRRRLAA